MPDHPVEETKRILLAVLLKHHDLGHLALAIVEHGIQTIPPAIVHVWQTVFNATYSLVKIHQECQRSYKEVCMPVIERALFLFNELRQQCLTVRSNSAVSTVMNC